MRCKNLYLSGRGRAGIVGRPHLYRDRAADLSSDRAQKQTELQLSEGEIVDILRVSTTWWVARKQNGIIGGALNPLTTDAGGTKPWS